MNRRASRLATALGVALLALGVLTGGGAVALWHAEVRLGERVDAAEQAGVAMRASQQEAERRIANLDATTKQLETRAAVADAAIAAQVDAKAVATRVSPSVFEIEAGDATGTAWVVSQRAGSSLLVTDYHVVAAVYEAGFRSVNLVNHTATYTGTITRVDETADLALVSVPAMIPALHPAPGAVAVGEPVLVVGSSLGLEGSVSTGIVSGLRTEAGRPLIQFTAPVSPGNSGGPVVDGNAQVVGVTEMKVVATGAEGLGFAIPVSVVCSSLSAC